MVFVLTQLRGPFPTKGAWDRLMPGDLAENLIWQKVPLQRVGDHQELANLAAYTDFSAYINGEVVVIDGGEWLKALVNLICWRRFQRNFGTN
jgi:NAD(P)-dependent dehydrogenase (short-subunit alcohol dehydrogenase family)